MPRLVALMGPSTTTALTMFFSLYSGGQRSTVGMLPPSDSESEEEEEEGEKKEGEEKEGEEKPKAKAASSSKGGQSKNAGACVHPPSQVLKQVLQGALVSPPTSTHMEGVVPS
jgi:hypothetical protein